MLVLCRPSRVDVPSSFHSISSNLQESLCTRLRRFAFFFFFFFFPKSQLISKMFYGKKLKKKYRRTKFMRRTWKSRDEEIQSGVPQGRCSVHLWFFCWHRCRNPVTSLGFIASLTCIKSLNRNPHIVIYLFNSLKQIFLSRVQISSSFYADLTTQIKGTQLA